MMSNSGETVSFGTYNDIGGTQINMGKYSGKGNKGGRKYFGRSGRSSDDTEMISSDDIPVEASETASVDTTDQMEISQGYAKEGSSGSRTEVVGASYIADPRIRGLLAKLAHLDKSGLVTRRKQREIGGGFGDVYIGTIDKNNLNPEIFVEQPGPMVKIAVKVLKVHVTQDQAILEPFVKEIRLWSKLNHPNILPLFGYLMDGDSPSIISEWMDNGTAKKYVSDHDLTTTDLFDMFLGISKGVEYLHGKGIIHSDLKAVNILISQSKTPLICDFGVSRILGSSSMSMTVTAGHTRGSTRWMAPELFDYREDTSPLTNESDIWAMGMTFYELLTKQVPFYEFWQEGPLMFNVMSGKLPRLPMKDWDAPEKLLYTICLLCWPFEPKDRLKSEEVIKAMTNYIESSSQTMDPSEQKELVEWIIQELVAGMESRSKHLEKHISPYTQPTN